MTEYIRIPLHNSIQIYNKNGDLMCGAVGCRKHKHLYFAFRGAFCDKHLLELEKIRKLIKSAESSQDELKYRNEEMHIRKMEHKLGI